MSGSLPIRKLLAVSLQQALAATTLLLTVGAVTTAQGQTAAVTRVFAIPPQSLASALEAYSRITGIDLVFAQSLPTEHNSPGAQGQLLAEQALTQILAGSGLSFRFEGARRAILEQTAIVPGVQTTGPLRVQSTSPAGSAGSPGKGASQYIPQHSNGLAPGVSSSRIAMAERQEGNSLLRSMPGTYSLHSRSQPGLQVNIRGLAGAGRVNTMVDGVTQTFRNNAGHGSGGSYAYVDPFLLAGVDIQRGSVNGADGAGTLGGSANFRTLGIDDLLDEGRSWGGRIGYRHGNNGYGSGRTLAGAMRKQDQGGDREFGLMAAASSSNSSEYATANGEKNAYDSTRQSPESLLLKARMQPNERHQLDLSWMRYENDFYHNYPWQISARNQRAQYHYTPYSEWIDLSINLSANKTRLYYPPVEESTYIGRRTHNDFKAVDATNVSRFAMGRMQAQWSNGVKYQDDDFIADTPGLRGANPQGRSKLGSVFSTLEMKWSIYAVTAALRHDHYTISGYVPACSDVPTQCEQINGGDLAVRRSFNRLNPSLQIAMRPLHWLQVFTELSRSSRPPRVQEMFFEKIPLSADASDADGVGANPFLKEERSRNLQLGAVIDADSLFVDGDYAQLRLTHFINRIDGYIKPQYLAIVHPEGIEPFVVPINSDAQLSELTDPLSADDFSVTTRWMNHPTTVKMRGYELEAHYATANYHATLSWTRSKTTAPAIEYVNLEDINSLPDRYWTLDVGGRWWQQRLQAGLRAEYSGPTEEGYDFFQTRNSSSTGVLLDFYASAKLLPNTTLWLNIENLQDKAYNYTGSIDSIMSPVIEQGNGRGRTVSLGLNVEF